MSSRSEERGDSECDGAAWTSRTLGAIRSNDLELKGVGLRFALGRLLVVSHGVEAIAGVGGSVSAFAL